MNGGEGGIRTPDTLTSMPDFESGASSATIVFTDSCRDALLRCYLECHTKSDRLCEARTEENSAVVPNARPFDLA
jgi:hypothetical protein